MTAPEFVQLQTSDSLTLPGLLYAAPSSKKIALFLHGNGTSCVFYSKNNSVIEVLHSRGISSLLFNNRGAHMLHSNKRVEDGHLVRVPSGMSHEVIAECVIDIDCAIEFVKSRGYEEIILIGSSTGANKICVYDHYKPDNIVSHYMLLAGGDDAGIYYQTLGEARFRHMLGVAKRLIESGESGRILTELVDDGMIFSAAAFYDIANPDGDYNCFPFMEHQTGVKLSTARPLFDYFSHISKPTTVIYGELDEYCGEGGGAAAINILKLRQPTFGYELVQGADHGFYEHEKDLARAILTHL